MDRLDDLLREGRRDPAPGLPNQTVASVIERYIEVVFAGLAARHGCTPQTQSATVRRAPRLAAGRHCRPDHLQEWLGKHPAWNSDWHSVRESIEDWRGITSAKPSAKALIRARN